MTLAEGPDAGTELSALGIGSFAEKTLVAAGQCTKVDPQARPAAVGLVGCGAMAGLGAAINTGAVTRGKSVAVIGGGGVGVAAIAGSAPAGASPIIAVDIDAKKLVSAKRTGATHTVDSSALDPVAASEEICAQTHEGARAAMWWWMRSAGRTPGSRRSTPATWPARWSWSACRPRR